MSRRRPASSCSGFNAGMATIAVQLGLATMPFGIDARAPGLTSETTRGTSGSIRQAEVLSMTMAPAAATRGAISREAVAPVEHSAMSIPEQSAVAASSTATPPPAHGSTGPADRLEPKRRMSSTGKERSAKTDSITVPTCPVAPKTPTRTPQSYWTTRNSTLSGHGQPRGASNAAESGQGFEGSRDRGHNPLLGNSHLFPGRATLAQRRVGWG